MIKRLSIYASALLISLSLGLAQTASAAEEAKKEDTAKPAASEAKPKAKKKKPSCAAEAKKEGITDKAEVSKYVADCKKKRKAATGKKKADKAPAEETKPAEEKKGGEG